jgi:hypothetical protein
VGLIARHLLAILFYLLRGKNLIGPMMTGRSTLSEGIAAPRMAHGYVLVLGLLLAVAVFMSLWHWGG